ncbi:MAG: response regulator [Deltaproteobacteria bacterium]|nr:response regulator [Deltaproteobacteria bacterium]
MDRIPATDPVRRDVEEVWNAGRRAAALTGQLLAFSRRQVLQPAALDLNAIVEDTQKMLRRLIGEDVRLETVLAAKEAGITADRGQVEQVIVNLAVNARDAMLQGGVLTVGTADADLAEALEGDQGVAVPAGRWVELWVRDTGCGMDAETRAHAFEPFFTTKGPGKGTGLGLAVVYGIVKQSGGYVFVGSEPGRGAHFRIFLPRNDAAARPAAAGVVASERPCGSETILVVEDEDAVRVLVCDVLKRCGYDVIPAADGPEAFDIVTARAGAIHMLLTDVVMPGMNGRQLADLVLAVNRDVRVVFTSGYTDGDAVFLGLLRDGAVFLQKPFDPAHLARVVREQLDGT